MVSSSHEAMHRIFQKEPGVFGRAFRALDLPFPEPIAVSLLPNDLTETAPLERRVDTLLRFDTEKQGSCLVAVEAQSRKEDTKPASWAYYTSYLHAKYRLPTVLLVTCQEKSTAVWAAGPFSIGPVHWPMLTIRPLVLGPHNVPVITDARAAASDIPLATLSAITHGKDANAGAILSALADALRTIDREDADIFSELTEQGLANSPALKIWRELMAVDTAFFRSERAMKLRDEGRTEGRAEERAEAVLRVLQRRGIEVPEHVRQQVVGCDDLDTLGVWFDRSLTVVAAEELFVEG
ncbi:hypothetical protein [Streptomyces alboflavus]|uniref:hypothetical protein n=1 Tax=Streptomyces alboflavus TaxID=67267 RepID=UPI0004C20D70|nr:hypothetical protein [Streptomyces alboflavus]